MEIAVNINNNSHCNRRLRCTYTNTEQSKEKTFHLPRKEQAVEGSKINIDRIEYQLNGNQHGYQVTPCDETEHADEKQQCRKHKEK